MSASNANRLVYNNALHTVVPCHKIRLNPTPKTSANQFTNPTRKPISTQTKPKPNQKPISAISASLRDICEVGISNCRVFIFHSPKNKKPTQAGQKTKERQSSQVSESISESPEREKNAAKTERERELEEKNATGRMGGREML